MKLNLPNYDVGTETPSRKSPLAQTYLLAILMASSTVNAELALRPSVTSRAEYENNPRLRPTSPPDVIATKNTAQFDTEYSRPTYNVRFVPRVRVSRYTEETDLNSEDYFALLSVFKRFQQHQFFGEFNYEREASITTEQLDSGIFDVNVPRTTFSLNSSWQYAVNDRVSTTVFGNALDVSFEEDSRSPFIDYGQFGLGVSLNYALSERTTWVGTFSTSDFKTPETSSETRSYSFQVGFEHKAPELLDISFRIGHMMSKIDFLSAETQVVSIVPLRLATNFFRDSERSSGEIINLSVDKEFERAKMGVEWSRSFSPSSQGARQSSENVYGFARYRITQFLDAGVRVFYRERTQEGEINTRRIGDIRAYTVSGDIRYRITPELRAEFGFRFRFQERLNSGTKADAQLAFMAIRYTPRGIRLN